MPKPNEHKTVQARLLQYAQEIGWTFVPRAEAENRRGKTQKNLTGLQDLLGLSLFFDDLVYQKVREFNPLYADAPGALVGQLRRLAANIYGNREMLVFLRNHGKFFCAAEHRERDVMLIHYGDPTRNVYEVTEEFAWHNGRYGNREDVVFLINGLPILVVECKNANKDEGIALGIDQIRRYHVETPELFIPEMAFTVTDALGFDYGATWNTVRRNLFHWKQTSQQPQTSQVFETCEVSPGNLEGKTKTFFAIPRVLKLLKDYIIFAEKDEELGKFILQQHQTAAIEQVVARAHDPAKRRGLVWHTQGSGKTFTMLKTADLLFKAPESDKPTILLLIDRNELEDQLLKNLAALGMENVEHAHSMARLNQLLREDYRGIIVSTIHKFRDMPANLNQRANIYVLVDEAHRTTGGDLGNYLMAALPHATYLGFTGTPIDRTAYGQGTFKTFGVDDAPQGYLHKYSIQESIADGTTLPLFYNLAPNDMLVPADVMEQEFFALAETEGIADIAELNKILERAVNLKNFLKGKARIKKVAEYVAAHYRDNVEPLGYKAFLVAVDREACALYKKALDTFLPPAYSEVVYTGNNSDKELLKEFHIDEKQEKAIRKNFAKFGELPKILIVTEKLLTGFDAPILYAMYLDKPMRDHTLLQAIARVNRPYENEAQEMVKPHGFVLDFVGIFDKLEHALSFDSDEVNAVIKDLALLKILFKNKMEQKAPAYLALITHNFNDKDVDGLIEHFRDKERRKELFKEYKEIEMLYEIISPDAFMRPYLDDYATLSEIYAVVRKAYAKTVYVDRAFQKKTSELVQQHIDASRIETVTQLVEINAETIQLIQQQQGDDNTKVINLVKSIEKIAEDASDDPYLVGMAERAKAVQESYEDRQTETADAIAALLKEIEANERRKREQAEKGFDSVTYFVYATLLEANIPNPETVSQKIKAAIAAHPNWAVSEKDLRELRQKITFALYAESDDLDHVAVTVDHLLNTLKPHR
ncbi:type I site-specific deoxyribonuclease, HsdR family [Candidatus Moduliflexus flocculans]|uniref:Type I restriction enzyme endonuclease subunit n=1 Tax=Candidatus Moduliflexus flocculans TaxID=1499966 RepID=A0A081BP70_9BACT|nr:type I site-specific deoxyribonuclease, HsdR family [Candidatus Moduliflexus flocculans]